MSFSHPSPIPIDSTPSKQHSIESFISSKPWHVFNAQIRPLMREDTFSRFVSNPSGMTAEERQALRDRLNRIVGLPHLSDDDDLHYATDAMTAYVINHFRQP